MNISDFQRNIGGSWVDLENNPYLKANENIYWDQTGVDLGKCNWLCRKIGLTAYQKLSAQQDPTTGKWYVNFPADSASGNYYEFVAHFQDTSNNTLEKTYLVIVDKTTPAVVGGNLWCDFWGDATQPPYNPHSQDRICYLCHSEVTQYSIDEVNSTWKYKNLDGNQPQEYIDLPDCPGFSRYFDWDGIFGRFRGFMFPVKTHNLVAGRYEIMGELVDKAGNVISSPQIFRLDVS